MALYNVIAPCVVGNLHYTRRSVKPIEVEEGVAAPLVSSGKLAPVFPVVDVPVVDDDADDLPSLAPLDDDGEMADEVDEPSPRRRRRS